MKIERKSGFNNKECQKVAEETWEVSDDYFSSNEKN